MLGDSGAPLQEFEPGNWLIIVVEGSLLEVRSTTMEDGGELWVVVNKSEELRLQAQIAEQGHVLASSNEAYMVVDSYGSGSVCERFL